MKCCRARAASVGRSSVLAMLAALVWSEAAVVAGAADEGQVVGKTVSPAGTLLQRTGKAWRVLPPKSDVSSGQYLLSLPGSRGEVVANNGAVQLSLWGNLPAFYDYPLLDS